MPNINPKNGDVLLGTILLSLVVAVLIGFVYFNFTQTSKSASRLLDELNGKISIDEFNRLIVHPSFCNLALQGKEISAVQGDSRETTLQWGLTRIKVNILTLQSPQLQVAKINIKLTGKYLASDRLTSLPLRTTVSASNVILNCQIDYEPVAVVANSCAAGMIAKGIQADGKLYCE